jgi:hypothetical protein
MHVDVGIPALELFNYVECAVCGAIVDAIDLDIGKCLIDKTIKTTRDIFLEIITCDIN